MENPYFNQWNLTHPLLIAQTDTSFIYRVRKEDGGAAILKYFTPLGRKSEGESAQALRYFAGQAAVRLLRDDEGALLLESVDGPTLTELSATGKDDDAAHIIADVVTGLHADRPLSSFSPQKLSQVFQTLQKKVEEPGVDVLYVKARGLAEKLIASEVDPVFLHGDLHHSNVMNSSTRGWLAIDPKPLWGERTYDLANVFYNPHEPASLVSDPDRMRRYAQIFAERLSLDPHRILQFAFVHGALSACWCLEDGKDPARRLGLARTLQSLI